jgi:hypothetical protein
MYYDCYRCGEQFPLEELTIIKAGILLCDDCFDVLVNDCNYNIDELERICDVRN